MYRHITVNHNGCQPQRLRLIGTDSGDSRVKSFPFTNGPIEQDVCDIVAAHTYRKITILTASACGNCTRTRMRMTGNRKNPFTSISFENAGESNGSFVPFLSFSFQNRPIKRTLSSVCCHMQVCTYSCNMHACPNTVM